MIYLFLFINNNTEIVKKDLAQIKNILKVVKKQSIQYLMYLNGVVFNRL